MSVDRKALAARYELDLSEAWADGARRKAAGEDVPRPSHCGGALMYLTRKEAVALKDTYRFDTDPEKLPDEGRWGIRLRCPRDIFIGKDGTRYALCLTCSEREKESRELARQKAQQAKQPETSSTRRKGFTR